MPGFSRSSGSDRLFRAATAVFWAMVLAAVLYPMWLVLLASVSDPDAVNRGQVLLWPVGFSLRGYMAVLGYADIRSGAVNSLVYTVSGTAISVLVTMACAYALSRPFPGKRAVSFYILFTMFFSGGLIPIFLTMRDLRLYNTPWVMILTNAVSVWNLMVAKGFLENALPPELEEAAFMDGAGHILYFARFVLPLSGSILAVLSVYYGIAKWNDYFTAMVMLRDRELFPLQLIVKEILAAYGTSGQTTALFDSFAGDTAGMQEALRLADTVKYCCVVVTTLPAAAFYLVFHRHFASGVAIGAIKG